MSANTEADVAFIADICSLDLATSRALIASALSRHNNDINHVIDAFLGQPREELERKYLWDDTAFSSNRDGTFNTTGIAFNIEAPPVPSHSPPPIGAPSRPPSRTDNRSPLGRLIDWTAHSASGAPTSQEQYDEDLSRAMAASMGDAGIVPPQETGVTGQTTTAATFGPATREDYDMKNWSLQHVGGGAAASGDLSNATATEPAYARHRSRDTTPAFLVTKAKGHEESSKLGPVITILHEIPLARNILLQCGRPAETYGHNSVWWQGSAIIAPHLLQEMQAGQQNATIDSVNFEEELHRLMAFLDDTNRSYGSVRVLSELVPSTAITQERSFYDRLMDRNGDTAASLCSTATMTLVEGPLIEGEQARFGLVEMEFGRDNYSQIKTLYEAWDHLIWIDALSWHSLGDGCRMAVLKDMGEVIGTMFSGDGPEDSIEIPEVWYPEKYLAERKDEARILQEHWAWTKRGLYKGLRLDYHYENWVDPQDSKVVKRKEALERVIDEFRRHAAYLEGTTRFAEFKRVGYDETVYPDADSIPIKFTQEDAQMHKECLEVVKKYEADLVEVNDRTKRLETDRQFLRERQRLLGAALTDPDKPGVERPFMSKKYLLRGIATTPDSTYLCRRTAIDEGIQDQWWRLAYDGDRINPVIAEKMELADVLKKVWEETKTPLLIYATEDALNAEPMPLPSALKTFVRFDNKVFEKELAEAESRMTEPWTGIGASASAPAQDPIASPGKRKYRDGSPDSMATNRASLGGASDTGSRADDFADDPDPFADGDGGRSFVIHGQGEHGEGEFGGGTELTQFPSPPASPREENAKSPEMQEKMGTTSPFLSRTTSRTTPATAGHARGALGVAGAGGDPMNLDMALPDDIEL